VFRFSEHVTTDALAAYCERIFLRHPWLDPEIPSLVYDDERGRLAGFLGVIPRPMVFQGQVIQAAVATQLMVAPESRGLAGRRLVRGFLSGPQGLSLSDTANEAARRLWEALGGSVSVVHSLTWERVLRPCRYLGSQVARAPLLRGAMFALRPVLAAGDALAGWLSGRFAMHPPPGGVEPLDAAAMTGLANDALGGFALHPHYQQGPLAWLLAEAAEKRQFGELASGLVRSRGGEPEGWFLHYVDRGGTSQVLQLVARAAGRSLVMEHLLHDAWHKGASAIAGRLEPGLLQELGARRCGLRHQGPWVLFHARRPEIVQAIKRGDAFLSRLDGEWWLSF